MGSGQRCRYEIEDSAHSEPHLTFDTLNLAEEEVRRISQVPYGKDINRPPSTYPAREWHIIEYTLTDGRWVATRRRAVLDVTPTDVVWHERPWSTVRMGPDGASETLASAPFGGANTPGFVQGLGDLLKAAIDALRF